MTQKPAGAKKLARILAVCSILAAGVLLFVSSQTQLEVRLFQNEGVLVNVRITEFREVSSGRQPQRRTIAIARAVDGAGDIPRGATLTSHILMSPGEVELLRGKNLSPVRVLPSGKLPETFLPGEYWFVSQQSLERHRKNPVSTWGRPAAGGLLVIGVILGFWGFFR